MTTHPHALPHIANLSPYQASLSPDEFYKQYNIQPQDAVQVASNENPYGMSPKAQEVAAQMVRDAHRYPNNGVLQAELAGFYGLDESQVAVGSGSNDILDLIARVFLTQGDEAISGQYTFMVYAVATQTAGATNIVVPAKEYGLDLAAMKHAITPRTKVIWLVNPNNPTGTFVPYYDIKQFIADVPQNIIVVLDEAYYEYLAPEERADTVQWLREFPNLIITRTFSKIYGLAGFRIGYGMAAANIISLINRVRLPFNVGTPALATAIAALQDQDFIRESRERNQRGLEQLQKGLEKLEISYIPSHANFVVAEFADVPVIYTQLLHQGIITRPLTGYDLPHHLRISVGKPEENERLLQALGEILR